MATKSEKTDAQKRTRQRVRAKAYRRRLHLRDLRQARTLLAQGRFLADFAQCGNVLRSAQAAGVGRRLVYQWRDTYPKFAALYAEALEDALDALEEEARRRAVDGVLEPVVSAGKYITDVRKFSDTLLVTLLKGKRPDTYRERHEVMGKDGGPILTKEVAEKLTDEDVALQLAAYAAKAGVPH